MVATQLSLAEMTKGKPPNGGISHKEHLQVPHQNSKNKTTRIPPRSMTNAYVPEDKLDTYQISKEQHIPTSSSTPPSSSTLSISPFVKFHGVKTREAHHPKHRIPKAEFEAALVKMAQIQEDIDQEFTRHLEECTNRDEDDDDIDTIYKENTDTDYVESNLLEGKAESEQVTVPSKSTLPTALRNYPYFEAIDPPANQKHVNARQKIERREAFQKKKPIHSPTSFSEKSISKEHHLTHSLQPQKNPRNLFPSTPMIHLLSSIKHPSIQRIAKPQSYQTLLLVMKTLY